MQYYPSPFNIIALIFIGIGIYILLVPGPTGLALFFVPHFIGAGLIALIVDALLQRFIPTYYRTVGIELVLIGLIYIGFLYKNRSKTLVLEPFTTSHYVTMVYGVEGTPALPISLLPKGYQLPIPKEGILFTSSTLEQDFKLGKVIQQGKPEQTVIYNIARRSELQVDGRTFPFVTWKVSIHNSISINRDELDALEVKLKDYLMIYYSDDM